MSLNLYGIDKATPIDFWQTPTYIVMMVFVQENGMIKSEMRGKQAWRGLQMYVQWVQSTNIGSQIGSEDDIKGRHVFLQNHIQHVLSFVGKRGVRIWWA